MLYAEWSGKRVTIRREDKSPVRVIYAHANVVGVQCNGNNSEDGIVAIAMENGKTDLYHANGAIIRRG